MTGEIAGGGFVVVTTTRNTRRRMYESNIAGQPTTSRPEKARVWTDREAAERWARQTQHDIDMGVGGRIVTVEPAPLSASSEVTR